MEAQPLPLELTLRAIARLEAARVRDPRLSDPDLVAWNRFRRKLGFGAFIEMLHEDLAHAFPVPFDLDRWRENPVRTLSEERAHELILSAARAAHEPAESPVFLRDCARSLGLPGGGAFSDLPKIQSQHHALELPGSGGRIAAALHGPSPSPSFHAHFTSSARR